jgi:chemotaxis signal transduction protein
MMTITPIPHISKIVKGIINIRGEDILVVSLRSHFGLTEEELQLYTPLLLLKLQGRSLVLIVDAVLDVVTLPLEKVTNLQNILPEGIENIPMLRGISYHNNEAVLVLDPDHLFYDQHILTHNPIEPRTSAISDMYVSNMPIEDALVSALDAKPIKKRKPVAKSAPVEEDALTPALLPEQLPTEDASS